MRAMTAWACACIPRRASLSPGGRRRAADPANEADACGRKTQGARHLHILSGAGDEARRLHAGARARSGVRRRLCAGAGRRSRCGRASLDNFAGFCERARRFGLTASLEFVPQRDLATLAQALRLIAESGQPNAAICVDPLHLARGGGAPDDLRNLDLRLLPYIQFSDGMLAEGEPDLEPREAHRRRRAPLARMRNASARGFPRGRARQCAAECRGPAAGRRQRGGRRVGANRHRGDAPLHPGAAWHQGGLKCDEHSCAPFGSSECGNARERRARQRQPPPLLLWH